MAIFSEGGTSFPDFPLMIFFILLALTAVPLNLLSDPDLPGCSGERVLPGESGCPVYRGQIAVNFLYRGNFILPVNRGSGKSGPGKSGSDCILKNSDFTE
eukprot:sb/3478669/